MGARTMNGKDNIIFTQEEAAVMEPLLVAHLAKVRACGLWGGEGVSEKAAQRKAMKRMTACRGLISQRKTDEKEKADKQEAAEKEKVTQAAKDAAAGTEFQVVIPKKKGKRAKRAAALADCQKQLAAQQQQNQVQQQLLQQQQQLCQQQQQPQQHRQQLSQQRQQQPQQQQNQVQQQQLQQQQQLYQPYQLQQQRQQQSQQLQQQQQNQQHFTGWPATVGTAAQQPQRTWAQVHAGGAAVGGVSPAAVQQKQDQRAQLVVWISRKSEEDVRKLIATFTNCKAMRMGADQSARLVIYASSPAEAAHLHGQLEEMKQAGLRAEVFKPYGTQQKLHTPLPNAQAGLQAAVYAAGACMFYARGQPCPHGQQCKFKHVTLPMNWQPQQPPMYGGFAPTSP